MDVAITGNFCATSKSPVACTLMKSPAINFDRTQKHAEKARELHDPAVAVKEREIGPVEAPQREPQAREVAEAEQDIDADRYQIADREGIQQAIDAESGDQEDHDQQGLEQEGSDPDLVLLDDTLQAGEHIGKGAPAQLEHEDGRAAEDEHERGGLQLGRNREGLDQGRQSDPEKPERDDTDDTDQRHPGREEIADPVLLALGVILGHVANVDVGDPEGTHPQIADEDEAHRPDAVLLQTDIGQDDRREKETGDQIEELGTDRAEDVAAHQTVHTARVERLAAGCRGGAVLGCNAVRHGCRLAVLRPRWSGPVDRNPCPAVCVGRPRSGLRPSRRPDATLAADLRIHDADGIER